jgi:DNA-binding FadR family transcriptional regulator
MHGELLKAIDGGRPACAEAALREHLELANTSPP